MKTKQLQRCLDEALHHVEDLVLECNGDDSHSRALGGNLISAPLDEKQRDSLRRFLQSWVEPALQAALVYATQPSAAHPFTLDSYADMLHDRSRFGQQLAAADDPRAFLLERF